MKFVVENNKTGEKRTVELPILSTLESAADGIVDGIRAAGRLSDRIRREIRADVAAVRQRDPAARGNIEVLMLYSGVHAILAYRVAHRLYLGKHFFSARAVSQLARLITGIEIHPGAKIGKGLFIDHGTGVVIGETSEIGGNVWLMESIPPFSRVYNQTPYPRIKPKKDE